jgi:outer membrane protein assembly factor BamB
VGPDGSIYGWDTQSLLALDAAGHQRWSAPIMPIEGGPPALAANGQVVVNGLALTGQGAAQRAGMAVEAIGTNGVPHWAVHALPWASVTGTFRSPNGEPLTLGRSVPLSKGSAPLISAGGLVYMPFAGPGAGNAGLEVFSSSGTAERRLQPGLPPHAFAQSPSGMLFIEGGEGNAGQLVASDPQGRTVWTSPLSHGGGPADVLVGTSGTIYVAVSNGLGKAGGELAVFTPDGRLRWRHVLEGGATLAEGSKGSLLVATTTTLSALSPDGAQLWHVALGHPAPDALDLPSLAVDASGTVYTGSPDGTVQAISANGTLRWSITPGAPKGTAPTCVLTPSGKLLVGTSDGVLRVYG